jgi:hypothetical protein
MRGIRFLSFVAYDLAVDPSITIVTAESSGTRPI